MGFVVLVLLLFGGAFMLGGVGKLRRDFRIHERVERVPTTPIAGTPGGATVEIQGRALPGESGVFASPFSGRPAVWVRVAVKEWSLYSHGSVHSYTVLEETYFHPFFVDDGSGQWARIHPEGANGMVETTTVARTDSLSEPPPHLGHFLLSRGKRLKNLVGFNRSFYFDEQLIAPGSWVHALGPSRRDPVSSAGGSASSSQLVLFAATGKEGELLLADKARDKLVRGLQGSLITGLLMVALGVLLILFGVVLAVVS